MVGKDGSPSRDIHAHLASLKPFVCMVACAFHSSVFSVQLVGALKRSVAFLKNSRGPGETWRPTVWHVWWVRAVKAGSRGFSGLPSGRRVFCPSREVPGRHRRIGKGVGYWRTARLNWVSFRCAGRFTTP